METSCVCSLFRWCRISGSLGKSSRYLSSLYSCGWYTRDITKVTKNDSVFGPSFENPDAIPQYQSIKIQLNGYDFVVLENFQKYIHKTAERMGLSIIQSWALPPRNKLVQRIKPGSQTVEEEYRLLVYRRFVQVDELLPTLAQVLLEVLHSSLPEGVKLKFTKYTEEDETEKYIPDKELKLLQEQLEEMGGPRDKKKRL